jgi:hypothetical protein
VDTYRSYRETIAVCIQIKRPDAEVETAGLEILEEKLEQFAPHVVICSNEMVIDSNDELARIELSVDLNMPARIRVNGNWRTMTNPTLDQLLALMDEIV